MFLSSAVTLTMDDVAEKAADSIKARNALHILPKLSDIWFFKKWSRVET